VKKEVVKCREPMFLICGGKRRMRREVSLRMEKEECVCDVHLSEGVAPSLR
jgi:hypothetical protein